MQGLLLFAFVTTVTVLLACDLTGRVNLASNKLLVTCTCRGPHDDTHDVTLINSLMIYEKKHFSQQTFLAKLEDGILIVDKYARKNRVVEHFVSEKQDRARLTLAFNPRRKYDFRCTVMGNNRTGPVFLRLKLMYDPKDYLTTTPPPPPTTTTTEATTTKTTTTETTTTTEATEAIITTTLEAITPAATTIASTTPSASSIPCQENEGQTTGDHSSTGRSSHASYTETVERPTTTKSKLPTVQTTTGTTSTDTPEIIQIVPTDDTPEKSDMLTYTLIIIVSVFAFLTAIALVVSIMGMVRKKSTATARHPLCTDAIPWDLLSNFLTATTSHSRAGQKHVTPSPPYSTDGESDTIASGSYAMCLTDTSSLHDADRDDAGHPFLPNDDVTLSGWSDDVSLPTSPKRIIFENELSNTSDTDDASDSFSDRFSSMSRTSMPSSAIGIIAKHSLPSIPHYNRDCASTLSEHQGLPSIGERSRARCPYHQRRHITSDRERPSIQAAPSSPQMRGPSMETTPRQLFRELSLNAEGGYIDETASQTRVLEYNKSALRSLAQPGEQSCVQHHNQHAIRSPAQPVELSCGQHHNQHAIRSLAQPGELSCVQYHNQHAIRSLAQPGEQSCVQHHNQPSLCSLALTGEQSCVQLHNQPAIRSLAQPGEQSCVQHHNQPAIRSLAQAEGQSRVQHHNQPAIHPLAEAEEHRTALDVARPAKGIDAVRQGSALAPQRCETSSVHRNDLTYLTPV